MARKTIYADIFVQLIEGTKSIKNMGRYIINQLKQSIKVYNNLTLMVFTLKYKWFTNYKGVEKHRFNEFIIHWFCLEVLELDFFTWQYNNHLSRSTPLLER